MTQPSKGSLARVYDEPMHQNCSIYFGGCVFYDMYVHNLAVFAGDIVVYKVESLKTVEKPLYTSPHPNKSKFP